MEFAEVDRLLSSTPFMGSDQGRTVYDFIVRRRLRRVLELGFAHGKSSCYFGAAVDEIDGSVLTIDRRDAEKRDPNIAALLDRCALQHRVTPRYAAGSFTWELMKLLDQSPQPRFDFVYLDAGHTWDVTGFGFCLVDRLLEPGGWLLFDDLNWTIAGSPNSAQTEWARKLPEEMRTTPQVRKVFDLLVRTHDDYVHVRRRGNWGWAQKRPADGSGPSARQELAGRARDAVSDGARAVRSRVAAAVRRR